MSTVRTLLKPNEIVNQGILKPAPLSNRFDASLLSPHLDMAEARFLKTFINKEFYDDLLNKRTANQINYNSSIDTVEIAFPTNADYEELFTQYLFSYIARSVVYEAYPFIAVQIGSNGLFLNNTDYGQNSGVKTMNMYRDSILQTLNGSKPLIIDFLCDNKDKYPLWDDSKYCGDCGKEEIEGRDIGFVFD
ncbi:hypothetical protein AB832_07005 [Flavobacteriaceae bacterium (ex Bugula neritina AB1)]|nr:hypothetical protein AB832_07005 [Flavobacteriaceae bacterium (ex Bugula neritina AB1)]